MEPPQKHGQWDFVGNIGPKVNFGYSSRQLTLTPEGGAPDTENVRVLHTLGLLAAKGNFYTPVGVFGLQLGAGGGGAFAWGAGVPADTVATGGGWFALAHADYSVFPLRTLFVSLSYDQLASLGPHLTTPSWNLSGLQMGSVTVGYFLPELKGWASNLF